MPDALKAAQAQVKDLKAEVSEKDKMLDARGRELTAARKKAATVDELQEELDGVKSKLIATEKALVLCQGENEDMAAENAKHESILEDVAALKRLVS